MGDGGVGCCATGAPTSNRARVEACSSRWAQADPKSRHTVDRGASCATPSREVVPCRTRALRSSSQTNCVPGPQGSGGARRTVLLAWAQRFGRGPRLVRGDVSPRAASGGPIHARLALGNSAMPALRMPRSDAAQDSGQTRPLLTRTGQMLESVPRGCRLRLQPLGPALLNTVR